MPSVRVGCRLSARSPSVEAFYQRVALPCLYRVTPYSEPEALDRALDRAGYVALDESRVMALELGAGPAVTAPACRARRR